MPREGKKEMGAPAPSATATSGTAAAPRPPTVPEGEACLRISLTAGHTEEMISALLAALAEGLRV